MDANAPAFVPKKRTTPTATAPAFVPKAEGSKLRAGAPEFAPRTSSSKGPETPTSTTSSNSAYPGMDHKMSPTATPYTPTRRVKSPTSGGAPSFPSAPPREETSQDPQEESPTTVGSPTFPPTVYGENSRMQPKKPVSEAAAAAAEIPKFNSTWTFYADDHPTRPQVQIGMGAPINEAAYNPVEVRLVGDVKDFWRLWRHVPVPSSFSSSTAFTYYWFRKDIKPSWEDARNKNGGTIGITLYDKDSTTMNDKTVADDAFLATMLMLTGESIPETANINGVVLKLRKTGKWVLQLWTAGTEQAPLQACFDALRTNLTKREIVPAEAMQNVPFFAHAAAAAPAAPAKKRMGGGKPAAPKFAIREPSFTLQ